MQPAKRTSSASHASRFRFRYWVITLVLAGSAVHGVAAASAADTWSGTWARAEVNGNLILTQTGSSVSGHYTWNDGSGQVSGTVSGSTFSGSFDETHYQGSFSLTLNGKSFSGSYSGTNKDTMGDVSGPFTGTCIAGDCLSNGAAPPPSGVPPITPTSEAPALDTTTDYRAPALGAVTAYPTPSTPSSGAVEEGFIQFVDNNGNPVEPPEAAAVDAQAQNAGKICFIMFLARSDPRDFEGQDFATCASAVARVLARADQIRQQQGAQAAAGGCLVQVHGKRRARSPLRVTCTATAQGLKVKIRARKGTLRKAIGKHKLKLVLGRSALATGPATARTQVRWHVP
jgi:hypothetical protein